MIHQPPSPKIWHDHGNLAINTFQQLLIIEDGIDFSIVK